MYVSTSRRPNMTSRETRLNIYVSGIDNTLEFCVDCMCVVHIKPFFPPIATQSRRGIGSSTLQSRADFTGELRTYAWCVFLWSRANNVFRDCSGFCLWTMLAMAADTCLPDFLFRVSVHDSAAIHQVPERGGCHWCKVAVYVVALSL